MKKTRMTILNIIFSVLFLAVIFVPFCMLDTTEVIDSTLENRRMTMWPGWHFDRETNEIYGYYAEDRVGFREEAVRLYIETTYKLFGEFPEKVHMYGKEGEIFPSDTGYIRAYQHLATDEELINNFVTYMDRTDEYLEQKGIPFFFLAGLDKKSVYGEYIPDYIRVAEDRESIMEMLARRLDESGVEYVIPISEYSLLKKDKRLYNKIADSAHWNAFGAMEGLKILNARIREKNPDVPVLSEEAFDLSYQDVQLEFISVPIIDNVPVYTLKKEYSDSIVIDYDLIGKIKHNPGTNFIHYVNEKALSEESILIMHDSFLEDKVNYFAYRYKDVYMISRQNYELMQYYVETLQPDVVVFENAERAFVDDLYAYVNLANVTYE
ncbi:MAG: hypothetical protein IJ429_01610 [Lachnospiraceae bacterium]|nr:hypothetical protein [Lachnospiraceae bacterium]